MSIIKIGIADDHRLFRRGLISLLSLYSDLQIIWEASDGKELIDKVAEDMPDVVLVDINMPKISGIEATKRLLHLYPKIKIIALSMYEDEGHILAMVENGARGYLVKDSEPSEIYISIKELHAHGYLYSSLVAKTLSNKTEEKNNDSVLFASLNDKEKQYLNLICKGFSSKEISEVMNLSPRTVEGYNEKLMDRLKAKNRISLVLFAIKHGIADL
jgi:DNA-binding NarL/FixJ family response regulator